MEYYGNNDWRDYVLAHSWGKRPEQKKREKEYNSEYYQEHKEEILANQRKRKVSGKGKGLTRREGLGSDKPISGNREMPSLSSAQKAFRNLTDDSIDDYGEFVAEMTEQGYKFKSREEQMALWKRFRKAKGNGSVVNEENEERKLGARITRANRE